MDSFKTPKGIKSRYEQSFLSEFAGRHGRQGIRNSTEGDDLQNITQNGEPHGTLPGRLVQVFAGLT